MHIYIYIEINVYMYINIDMYICIYLGFRVQGVGIKGEQQPSKRLEEKQESEHSQ